MEKTLGVFHNGYPSSTRALREYFSGRHHANPTGFLDLMTMEMWGALKTVDPQEFLTLKTVHTTFSNLSK